MSITQTIANDLVLDLTIAAAERPNRALLENDVLSFRASRTTRAADCLSLWVEGSYEADGYVTYERNRERLQTLADLVWNRADTAYRKLRSFVIEQFTGLTASEYGCSRSTAQKGVIRAFEIIAEIHCDPEPGAPSARDLLDHFNTALGLRLIEGVEA